MNEAYFFNSRLAHKDPMSYVTDKKLSCETYMNYMNIRLQKMFHYEGLPDTIPKEILEGYLINNGTCFIAKVNGDLYALLGSIGGELDPYYRPTRYIVANPGLKLTQDFSIKEDGILLRNDSLWLGLYPLMARYATLMAENVLTLRTADVMLRVMAMFTAPDDKTKLAAEEYLKNLEAGKLGVIGENRFFDEGVKMQSPPSNNGSYLTQFIELHQYLTGTFYNEIGLNANFNMKRESIGEGESSLNEDSLLPLCEEMLHCRKEDIEKVNKMFGTNITVDFDSAWANNQKEVALGLERLKNEASQLAGGDGDDSSGSADNAEGDNKSSESESEAIHGDAGITDEDNSETDSDVAGESGESEGDSDGDSSDSGQHDSADSGDKKSDELEEEEEEEEKKEDDDDGDTKD